MRTARDLLGGRPVTALSPAQRLALCEVLETFDVGAPEVREVVARMLGDESLRPTAGDWAAARERRAGAEAFFNQGW